MRPALGAVLVGGESRRYGSSKARAPVEGEPMAARPLSALRGRCDPVVLVGGEEELAGELGVRTLPDRHPGAGPLAGVEAALLHAVQRGRDGAFVVACDLPLVTGELVAAILARRPAAEAEREGDGVDAVLPEGPRRGALEPLCGWYGTGALDRARALLGGGGASMARFVGGLRVRPVPVGELEVAEPAAELFANVNTPDERRRVETILEGRG